MTSQDSNRYLWTVRAKGALVGRRITAVRFMTAHETEASGWSAAVPILVLDDDTLVWPSVDGEGNDAGALFTTASRLPVLPPLHIAVGIEHALANPPRRHPHSGRPPKA